jgi:hypothetical protein
MPPYTDSDLAADVAQHQWVVLKIAPPDFAEYGYTVGLRKSFGHPELAVTGLDDETMQELLNDIGEAIAGGARFADGDVSPDFLEGYDVRFRAVPPSLHASRFAFASRFHPDGDFTVLQVVYPDRARRWPWDAGVAPDFVKGQPLFEG